MTVYLLNAFPNSILVPEFGEKTIVKRVTEEEVITLLYGGFISAIGHDSTAKMLTYRLGVYHIEENRINVVPEKGDTVIVCAFMPPRRLDKGQEWTEKEILEMDLKFCKIVFGSSSIEEEYVEEYVTILQTL